MLEPSKNLRFGPTRKDRALRERGYDTSKKGKLQEPTVCPKCGAVFHEGRWTWMTPPPQAHDEMCPACQRVRDKNPAGILTLKGQFLQEHKGEILNLARNQEARAKAEHPVQRIIDIEEQEDGIVITTTDAHLVRSIGEAVHHAYHGELDFQYTEVENILRVHWER